MALRRTTAQNISHSADSSSSNPASQSKTYGSEQDIILATPHEGSSAGDLCSQEEERLYNHIQEVLQNETAKRDSLVAQVDALRREVWSLQNELLNHARCNDHSVDKWITENTHGASKDPPDESQCPSPSSSVSTRSEESIIDPGKGSNTPLDEAAIRQLYVD
ncbi:uncharacterized protein N7483_011374 [Penicillium malachiteum]|uniref:uncharacterized protein n=1 Tax=Penicillium malachiteum TaxID=1324776 RepID=UPI00254962F3|nr:uncharacterized protein N7483_011374 [Penicillium malachiteum]KAJ5714193.1 hypothetical protein N7483_011374 [Penicillium malachiteum]